MSLMFFSSAHAETGVATRTAWSGYWWPYNYGGLATGYDYRGNPAPLEKYELLVDGYLSGRLVDPYLDRYYDAEAPGWHGLCYAWAAASSSESEPSRPSVHDNILFRVGDKKGLYTLAHTNDVNLTAEGDKPQIFHQWLTEKIGRQKLIFYADLDASEEIWSYPIYAYTMEVGERIGDQQDVDVTITYAGDFVTRDFIGTDIYHQRYTYTLYYNEANELIDGEWTGDSITDHPQRMTLVQQQRSKIDGVDMTLLRSIGSAIDDELEDQNEVPLSPGTWQLISLDDDLYTLSGRDGDVLKIDAIKLPGPENPLIFTVMDSRNTVLDSFTLDDEKESISWTISGDVTDTYHLLVEQENYSEADFYQLDINIFGAENQQLLPYIPANGWWNGLALTNMTSVDEDKLCLTSLDENGRALESHIAQQALEGQRKIVTLFDNLPSRLHEQSTRQSLLIYASDAVATVNLFGGVDTGLGGFFSSDIAQSDHLILPLSRADWRETVWGGVLNRGDEDQTLTFSFYSAMGELVATERVELDAGAKVMLGSLSSWSKRAAGGWIDVTADNNEASLEAYQIWRSISNLARVEGLRGLTESREQWLPHVEDSGFWSTKLTLVNPQSVSINIALTLCGQEGVLGAASAAVLTLSPHEKRTMTLTEVFPTGAAVLPYCGVKLASAQQFSGYVSYDSAEDLACLPLIQSHQLSSQLCLPHLAEGYDWWTGVVLFNPQALPVNVTVTPVDMEGDIRADLQQMIVLSSGEKQAFTLGQYWTGDEISQFSHVVCKSDGGESIGGMFLFGRFGVQQVTGSLLSVVPAE
ncbi:DUF5719 family protein [uncultured Desulfuromonas sp.]|uniref:DUF5719 family protein n=1 Tax=uncultured Desulfuromonas sp. TaxID=181013 RepID=UPI002AAC0E40|nr:DUF5719 family protein [uncultured Desulfuromonas sp.]